MTEIGAGFLSQVALSAHLGQRQQAERWERCGHLYLIYGPHVPRANVWLFKGVLEATEMSFQTCSPSKLAQLLPGTNTANGAEQQRCCSPGGLGGRSRSLPAPSWASPARGGPAGSRRVPRGSAGGPANPPRRRALPAPHLVLQLPHQNRLALLRLLRAPQPPPQRARAPLPTARAARHGEPCPARGPGLPSPARGPAPPAPRVPPCRPRAERLPRPAWGRPEAAQAP